MLTALPLRKTLNALKSCWTMSSIGYGEIKDNAGLKYRFYLIKYLIHLFSTRQTLSWGLSVRIGVGCPPPKPCIMPSSTLHLVNLPPGLRLIGSTLRRTSLPIDQALCRRTSVRGVVRGVQDLCNSKDWPIISTWLYPCLALISWKTDWNRLLGL